MKANALIRWVLCAGLVDMAICSSTAMRNVGVRRVAVLRVTRVVRDHYPGQSLVMSCCRSRNESTSQ